MTVLSTGSHEVNDIWVYESGIISVVSFKFIELWTKHCISEYSANENDDVELCVNALYWGKQKVECDHQT